MDKDHQDRKEFLEQQLQWCKDQDAILEEMNGKLHEMKRIAEYALEHKLSSAEVDKLNGQLNELKQEVYFLESQLHSVVQ